MPMRQGMNLCFPARVSGEGQGFALYAEKGTSVSRAS